VCELDGPTPILNRSNTLQTKDNLPRGQEWGRNGALASAVSPFVLLDDAREKGGAWLYTDPFAIVTTRDPGEVRACLDRLVAAERAHVAGFIAYEAGHVLEPRLAPFCRAPSEADPPLLWFGLFETAERVDATALLPDPAGAWSGRPRPLVPRAAYDAAIGRVLEHIRAGDIYQANLTFRAELPIAGNPAALYAALRGRARAGHGALLFTGAHWILSLSPELFFTLDKGRIVTRPMKGTAERGADERADQRAIERLRADPKQRAENLMIVDLLRNDLSRVARPGSVEVPALFAVETYPTVHQMTSTVAAGLDDGLGALDVLRTIFPCGSITGAPKIRAMEIIDEIEADPRGVYTGAIGRVAPGGEAAFNVAIRTLIVRDGESVARLGLGSGIVADSRAGEEWRECLAKGAFADMTDRRFDLVETMRFDPHQGIVELCRHLERMKASADALDFAFDRHAARNELQAATFRAGPSRVRMVLARSGALAIELRPLDPPPAEPVPVARAALPVPPDALPQPPQPSDRSFYEGARAKTKAFETLFVDPEGRLTEGSFTNLFVKRNGMLLTPPLSRGLLPGVLRARLIEEGRAKEVDLTPEDLKGGFLIGNSLRGLMRAELA
jgi:para-aminobenzoate synthetase / 4-amino-4-deoxychorismate lyase